MLRPQGILDYIHSHPLAKEVNDATLRAIMKYRNHPSVLAVLDKYKNSSIFTFSHVTKEEFLKETGNLDTTKSSQGTDIPTKIIKQNLDIFVSFIGKTLWLIHFQQHLC